MVDDTRFRDRRIDTFEFGFADALPVPADYDAMSVTDFAIWRDGAWYIYEPAAASSRHPFWGKRAMSSQFFESPFRC